MSVINRIPAVETSGPADQGTQRIPAATVSDTSNPDIIGRIHSVETCGTVDGPGIRFIVFMQGCLMRCKYCHNRDTWDTQGGRELAPGFVVSLIVAAAATILSEHYGAPVMLFALLLAPLQRGPAGCGDYQHSSGVVVIPEGVKSGGFTVNILDDLCKERFMEYVQVTLSVPGSAALQGERLSTKIRIDDNDYDGEQYC